MARWYQWLAALLATAGLVDSGYLLLRSWKLVLDRYGESLDICSTLFGQGCDRALGSDAAWLLGIPLAGWGVVYFIALAALLLLAWMLERPFGAEARLGALLLSVAGLGVSIVLTVVMLGGWAPICPLCFAVHAVNLALPIALSGATGERRSDLWARIRSGAAYVVGRSDGGPEAAWKVLGFFTVALVGVVAYQWLFVQSTLRNMAAQQASRPEEVIKAFESSPVHEVAIAEHNPTLGPDDAEVTMVVFSNFQCPGCQEIAKEMTYLHEHFPRELRIVFMHYPISTYCNPAATVDRHPRACQAAYAAVAAERQQKFWAFHDNLFRRDLSAEESLLAKSAERAGLDRRQFDLDRESAAVQESVKADVAEANRLGIDGTPTVFLNGRRVPYLTDGAIDILIHHLVGEGQATRHSDSAHRNER